MIRIVTWRSSFLEIRSQEGEFHLEISEEIITMLKDAKVNFFSTHPCAKIRNLLNLAHSNFRSVAVAKEEEGVGICAGAALAGKNPAMLIQSTGLGNMVNALCSLTFTYKLPLLILASWRGVYKEKISAQIPLGKRVTKILQALGISFHAVSHRQDLDIITQVAQETYDNNSQSVILLSPQLWEQETTLDTQQSPPLSSTSFEREFSMPSIIERVLTRYDILQTAAPFLEGKLVICNIGLPSRELYQINHQSSNFYMLGSLGLASSIGLGVSLFTKRPVVVIDGDGSLLANLGSIATIAQVAPRNLSILAIDNGVHGSTGNQLTATSACVDLSHTASGLGINNVFRTSTQEELESIFTKLGEGPNFIHAVACAGNAQVPTIPRTPLEIKQDFMREVPKT